MRNFKSLHIWNGSISIVREVYDLARKLPREELYGLRSQMTRAAVSISSNIAEGCSRTSLTDYARFLELSLGSAYELETQLIVAEELRFLKNNEVQPLLNQIAIQQKMITNLISKVRKGSVRMP